MQNNFFAKKKKSKSSAQYCSTVQSMLCVVEPSVLSWKLVITLPRATELVLLFSRVVV
ncbi:hypothetical protein JZ751_011797 [Albula glossodonta]|uniref:Uncharacterized protein n=1 Tax=Albula glossodonta TaxID=121402 RepID=A0A8T2PQP7_9TELE|nr:hypothetical protein JZ751_011797 [Albula glossodonta]